MTESIKGMVLLQVNLNIYALKFTSFPFIYTQKTKVTIILYYLHYNLEGKHD
jgi:hypothetical protein